MVTDAEVDTVTVVTVRVAVVAPAATVTLAGTVAAEVLLLESVTTAPPAGAAALKVTVPVDELPPVTLAGFTLKLASDTTAAGFTVSVALCVPLYVPVIVTGVDVLTATVVTVNVAVVAPAATVTLAGTVATAVSPLASVTTAPPVGAAALKVTVPLMSCHP